jgi:hypothetical protein
MDLHDARLPGAANTHLALVDQAEGVEQFAVLAAQPGRVQPPAVAIAKGSQRHQPRWQLGGILRFGTVFHGKNAVAELYSN